ncbi:MAG: hypothetical protein Q9220_000978 [cf. Caloplaca sp. 1 TL-2023]
MTLSVEAKICVLGAQGVGKTSLVQRYVKGTFSPSTTLSTVGASLLTKRVLDVDSGSIVRLQLWDTAGQERYRSISKLYYRGASVILLVYDITDEQSFNEMRRWMQEVKSSVGDDVLIHVVGTKSDVVIQDPGQRMVPFERCLAYVAESLISTPVSGGGTRASVGQESKRSSGFWGQETGFDCCHEISAKDGEGIEEVFRVITRKLVEAKMKCMVQDQGDMGNRSSGHERRQLGRLDGPGSDGSASFRLGAGDKRRSWLGFPSPPAGVEDSNLQGQNREPGAEAVLEPVPLLSMELLRAANT